MDLFSLIPYDRRSEFLEDLFKAYYACRKNKRNTRDALAFELNLESNLFELFNEIESGTYQPGPSTAFIVNRPVKREIFAAQFRDRVVHHFVINRLEPILEALFLPESFACRKGKGTNYGIEWIQRSMRESMLNYDSPAYVLKLDISAFFMSIDRALLELQLFEIMRSSIPEDELALWVDLVGKIVRRDPTHGCVIRGNSRRWQDLPSHKSLFHSGRGKGLPIGNLTSQVFANVFLHQLDTYIRCSLGFEYYGRYVDDFILIHTDKAKLIHAVAQIDKYLSDDLMLILHPKKRYLQTIEKGVPFLGAVIYPDRLRMGDRLKNQFISSLCHPYDVHKVNQFQSRLNSYLGAISKYPTYAFRTRQLTRRLDKRWFRHGQLNSEMTVFQLVSNAGRRSPLV